MAVIGIVGVSAAEIRYLMQLSREAQDMGDLVDQISAVREMCIRDRIKTLGNHVNILTALPNK